MINWLIEHHCCQNWQLTTQFMGCYISWRTGLITLTLRSKKLREISRKLSHILSFNTRHETIPNTKPSIIKLSQLSDIYAHDFIELSLVSKMQKYHSAYVVKIMICEWVRWDGCVYTDFASPGHHKLWNWVCEVVNGSLHQPGIDALLKLEIYC